MRTASTSTGRSTTTCPSATGSTSAWGRRWPARKDAIALEETFKRFPEWSVDRDGAVPLHTSTVRGYSKLPISV